MKKNIFANRRFKYGSLATIITIGFVVAVILLNVVASILLERFPLTIDLTPNQQFQLKDESIELVQALDEDITITVCADETTYESISQYYKQAYETIRNYPKYSGHIKVRFVDLVKNPTFVQNYPDLSLTTYDVIIESAKRTRKISTAEFFAAETSQYTGLTTYQSLAEQKLTAAIMYVTDENPVKVAILETTSAVNTSGLVSLLESNNYEVVNQNLLTEEIDPEAAFVVLPQPVGDLSVEEITKIEGYLDNNANYNKSLLFIASFQYAIQPALKNFLAEWGIEVGDDIIYENNSDYAVKNYFTTINTVDEEITSQLTNPQMPLVIPYSKPINLLFEEKDGNRFTAGIAATSPTASLMPVDADENFDVTVQPQQSFNTVAKGYRNKTIDNEIHTSQVIAFGSDMMISPSYLQVSGYANSSVIVTLVNSLVEKKDTLQILPVDMTNESIVISEGQVSFARILLVIVFPIVILACGVVVWFRRRHL